MEKQYPTGPVTHIIRHFNHLEDFKQEKRVYFETLTSREKEVLKLIAQGKNNPEIANDLGISRATVQNYRAFIRQKLGIKNEQCFMKYALAFDLIDFNLPIRRFMSYLTENELLERFQFYIASLEGQLWEEENSGDIIDEIPIITIISSPEVIKFINTNKKHQQLTGYSPKDVREKSSEYTGTIVHPKSMENIIKFLPEFYAKQDPHQTMAFIQYVQLLGKEKYSPVLTFTKPPVSANGLVVRMSVRPGEMGIMSKKMERIVKMDQFRLKHFKRFQQLTKREIEILKLMACGHNNPVIAEQLFISRQTVETHRKSIKAKLALNSFRDLMRFALAFDLIKL